MRVHAREEAGKTNDLAACRAPEEERILGGLDDFGRALLEGSLGPGGTGFAAKGQVSGPSAVGIGNGCGQTFDVTFLRWCLDAGQVAV